MIILNKTIMSKEKPLMLSVNKDGSAEITLSFSSITELDELSNKLKSEYSKILSILNIERTLIVGDIVVINDLVIRHGVILKIIEDEAYVFIESKDKFHNIIIKKLDNLININDKEKIKELKSIRDEEIAKNAMEISREIINLRVKRDKLKKRLNNMVEIKEKLKNKGLDGNRLKAYNQINKGVRRTIKSINVTIEKIKEVEHKREEFIQDKLWKDSYNEFNLL